MAINNSESSQSGIVLSPAKEHLHFSGTTDSFFEKLDLLRKQIQYRGDVCYEIKGKYQQFRDNQIKKIEKEKEDFLKKNKELTCSIEENNTNISEIEHCHRVMKINFDKEETKNKDLINKINSLQLDFKQRDDVFHKTAKNYSTVINWYKKYLDLIITKVEGKNDIFEITFASCNNGNSHMQIQILDSNNFKVEKLNFKTEKNDEFVGKVLKKHEVLLLLCNFRKFIFLNK